ncbi:MAG: adenylate kinase [Anaerolineae bacterium]|nr:MAG: adenylate kinase [Anaerolineae bacterium]
MHFIVLLGVPGAGKGTQAKRLSAALALPHVSSGDLFRENLKQGTPIGQEARKYLSEGELVPDQITIEMIEERLAQADGEAGAILDGFPRTARQAEALENMAGGSIRAAVHVEVPIERLVERMSGRRVCRAQGHVYHIKYKPPKEWGICDIDGSELYQRDDDKPETVRHRLKVYEEQTAPLVEYYRERGGLVSVNGDQPIEAVTEEILSSLEREATS